MNVNELKTLMTRSVPGYLLAPEATFGEEKEKSVLSAFSLFISIFIISFLVFSIASLVIIDGSVSFARQITMIIELIITNSGLFLVEELAIIISVHLLARCFKKSAMLSDSLKIALISSAYWVMMVNLIASLNVLLQPFMQAIAMSMVFLWSSLLIIPGILFIWIAANGINALHGLSKMISCGIAVCTLLMAILTGYFFSEVIWDGVHCLLALW